MVNHTRPDDAPAAESADVSTHTKSAYPAVGRWRPDVPWVQDMIIAHRFFRLGLAALPELVESVRPDEQRRAGRIYDHYRLIERAMHRHQSYENAHIWPTIAQRAAGNSLLAERPLDHHRTVGEQVRSLEPLWETWVAEPTRENARAVNDRLIVLIATVNHNLDEEEADLVPLIERHLSVGEWASFGRFSASAVSRRELLLMAGMIADHLCPAEWEDMSKQQPGLAFMVTRLGVPLYRRYAKALGLAATAAA